MGTQSYFPWSKGLSYEPDLSLSFSTNEWSYTSTPIICPSDIPKESFTFMMCWKPHSPLHAEKILFLKRKYLFSVLYFARNHSCGKLFIYVYPACIQGVSRLVDITAGGNFLGLCDQKISHKRVRFWTVTEFGCFLIPIHALMWTASYGTSWWVIYSAWWLMVCGSCNEQLVQFTTEQQPVLWPVVAFSKTSFKHRSIQIKGNFTKLTSHLYFKCTMYYAGLLLCSVYYQ